MVSENKMKNVLFPFVINLRCSQIYFSQNTTTFFLFCSVSLFFCFFEDKKSFKKKVTKRKLFSFAKLNKIYCLFFFCCQLKLFQLISFLYIAEYIASAINLTVVHGYNLSSYLVPTSVFSDPSSLFVSDFLYNCNHLEGSV